MNGHKFLKVTGILMIIGGALAIVFGVIALAGMAALAYMASAQGEMGMIYLSLGLAVLGGIVELIAGIIGVKNSQKPEKAKACIVWGVLVAVLSLTSTVLGVVSGGEFSPSSLVLGLVLPVLYIIGAVMNMKTPEAAA